MDVVEEKIRELLAATGTVDGGKIARTSRLFHDLGLDGDDAAEFFFAVETEFGADLAAIYTPWNEHFGPELANPVVGGAIGMFVSIVISLIKKANPVTIAVEIALFVALIAILVSEGRRWRRRMKPITVGDVVSAVEQTAWSKSD